MSEAPAVQFDGEFHKAIVDNLHDGVYYVDLHRRITYWNSGAHRISGYAASEVLGRRCSDNVLDHTDDAGNVLCQTACPLAKTLADGRHREAHVFLRHKEGQRVPIAIRVAPIRDGSGRVVGAVEIFDDDRERVQSQQRLDELQQLALIDPLTGVGNRRYAEMTLRARLEDLERYGWGLGLLFVDLDEFKLINDRHGHLVGDDALRAAARTLAGAVRGTDSVARWGGDEFVAICPTADRAALRAAGERVRALVSSASITAEHGRVALRVSVGGAVAQAGDDPGTLVARADDAMYRAKQAGGDHVTIERDGDRDGEVDDDPTPARGGDREVPARD
jgi:diguanylate cyclase (GGDEF)-like protein/PAS domain S-box-containing protein